MAALDPEFVQPVEHRPTLNSNTEVRNVPVIDISSAVNGSPLTASDELIREVKDACRDWGFFQVVNHGVPLQKIKKVEMVAREFFALPLEEKKKVRRDEENPLGYYDSDHTKNVRDWKEIFDYTAQQPTLVPAPYGNEDNTIIELRNQWPNYPTDFRSACEEYTEEMVKLSFKILQLISLSLDLAADHLSGFFKDHTSFSRLNYYQLCPFPDLVLGVGPHKDGSAITVLAQDDVDGLEIRRKSDGHWIPMKAVPNAFIVNLGDVIQVWSNDRYDSIEHRVKVNPYKGRLSIPFFFTPSHYVMVKPIQELLDKREMPKYEEYNYGKFYSTRRVSDYKKLNVENIQVHHFKVAE